VDRGYWWKHRKEKERLEDLGGDGTIILKQIFKNWNGEGHGLD
jgi:hypothetical protein